MKKVCILLTLLMLLSGCSKDQSHPTQPTIMTTVVTEPTGPRFVSFEVYAINDLHGKLVDTDAQPGVDELSTYLKQSKNTILLSTGDMWQGASESNLTGGFMVTEWMNRLGFAAMTIGGHEFDWGEDQIRKNQELAEFPFLAINIYDRKTNTQVDYCQNSVVVDMDGAQIGIIGAIGNCYNSVSFENTKGVYFKTGPQLTELVKAEAEKLRKNGADFIIYAIHDGYDQNTDGINAMEVDTLSYYDTALSDGYVDLVFEADSHYWYNLTDVYGVYHLQAGGNNSGISHATVMLDMYEGTSTVLTTELIPASTYYISEDDPVIAELMEKYADLIGPATKTIGTNGQYRSGKNICQLVANLYCTKGLEKWGKDYDIVLGGGYISCRSPGYLSTGDVTYSHLQSLLPFDNKITLCSISGRDLIDKFLETDHYAYYIKTTPYGERIRGSIEPDCTYYVVTDSYTSDYAPNNLTVIDTYSADIFARDLLAEYIAAGALS